MAKDDSGADNDRDFVRRALIVLALGALVVLIWELRFVLVLLFGAVVTATVIRAIADPFTKHMRVPSAAAVLIAVLLIVLVLAGVGWLLGRQIAAQTQSLTDTLPAALNRVDDWLASFGLAHPIQSWLDELHSHGGALVSRFGSWASSASSGVANLLIVFFGGIFIAAQPRFYKTGAIKLVPAANRSLVAEAMDESEHALRLWLRGQLAAMLIIGVMTAAGLWLLGIESWLVLGILAGFFEFIPFAGPILSAIPGVLIALVQSPELALWTALMYVFVQHSEAYLIQPLVQQYAVDVPAVVLLFALLAFAILFGVVGVFFAAPLTVVSYVLVKRLYVVEALDTPTPIPGQDKK
ncbi:MAG TPA: AI-2E family transporter [Sphingomicrobium sp.]|nr:AI-2E family transporter [Sphingomicrobium sp.]